MYGREPDEPVANSGKEAFAALDLLERKLPPQSSVEYPNGPIGNSLRQLARLIKAGVGLRVGCADAGGWDTHAAQNTRLQRVSFWTTPDGGGPGQNVAYPFTIEVFLPPPQ